jgi:predicted RNA-binding Zn-ribbon protein involved in translation (DUF1610 family)
MEDKKCPKCPNSPVMRKAQRTGAIPVLLDERFSTGSGKIYGDKAAITVAAYECPDCHLVELYRET